MKPLHLLAPNGCQFELQWNGKHCPTELTNTSLIMDASLSTSQSNHLILGDNLNVLGHVLKEYRGQVDLIYLDPPFASGANYSQYIDRDNRAHQYSDRWKTEHYLQYLYEILIVLRSLLSEEGSLYLHCDHHQSHRLRMIADEVFGESNFINHIIWSYKTGGVPERVGFSKKHDDILLYSKSSKPIFNRQQQRSYVASLPEPHTKSGQKLGVQRDPNCEFCATGQPGPKYRQVVCRDHWSDIPALYRNSAERCNYPTQKPEALLSRMISASSTKKSLVLDPFCGSGTTLAAARALGRNYIGIDCNPVAIQCSANRLLPTVDFQRWRDPQAQIKNCSAEFEIKENRIFLVKYHDQDGQELNPEQWLISIWIDCNYTGIFSPTLFSKRPVLTEWILPEEWGIIEIEVVDAKGAIWKGQIN